MTVRAAFGHLPLRHVAALEWYEANAGRTTGWPEPLPDGTLLACRPKGIYKPAWSEYALSIRESLVSTYPDRTPISENDGGWLYRYFQENHDPGARDVEFTNRALLLNARDGVPVGVFIQISLAPRRYKVLGLGLVQSWHHGYFPIRAF